MRVVVDAAGKLQSAKVVHTTQPELEAATLTAVEKWSFLKLRDGRDRRRKGMTLGCRSTFNLSEDDE